MTDSAQTIADALVDIAATVPQEQIAGLVDAALSMLQEQGRLRDVRLFPRYIDRAIRKRSAVLPAQVITATPLSSKDRDDLKSALERRMTQPVDLSEEHDAALLGGAVVLSRDQRFDASLQSLLRAALETLRAPHPIS